MPNVGDPELKLAEGEPMPADRGPGASRFISAGIQRFADGARQLPELVGRIGLGDAPHSMFETAPLLHAAAAGDRPGALTFPTAWTALSPGLVVREIQPNRPSSPLKA